MVEIALREKRAAESGERVTDGKGRTRWEKGENKSRGARSGLMSRRTCANWSGSLAGGPSLPLPSRIEFSATRLDSRLRTLTPYLLYFSFASSLHLLLLFFIFRLLIPSLRPSANLVIFPLLFCITFPSFPLDSCCQLKPSCQPSTYPVLFPHSIPYHSTIPSHLPPTPIPLCLQKVAQHLGLCAAPFPLRGQLARSSLLPAENVQIIGSVSIFHLA